MIDPSAIPAIPGDMTVLGTQATAVSGVGTDFPDTGRRVHSTWQGLAAVYHAPEADQLFAATGPVQTVTASVGQDVATVGSALSTYATEVAAIKTRLETLRSQATEFVETVADDDDWRESEDDVDRHNQLLSDVNAAVADFMDAQRRCANAILALYSDKRYSAENGDGTVDANEFGYTKEQLDGAAGEDGALPWGTAEEHDRGFFGDVGAFFVGVKDGAVGMVVGLGGLIGYADGEWSWSNAGMAWKGLGVFALALTSVPLTVTNAFTDLPGLPKGTLHNSLLNAGKAIIAYDTWGEDKSKAAGMTTFNIVSAVIGTKGATSGLRGAGAAAEASRFGTVARAGTILVKTGDFIASLPTVESVIGGAARRIPGLHIPHIDMPDVDVPRTDHVDTPRVDLPDPVLHSDGPSVGDALTRTPDSPLPHVDTPHVHSDVPSTHVDTPGTHGDHTGGTSHGDGTHGTGTHGTGTHGGTHETGTHETGTHETGTHGGTHETGTHDGSHETGSHDGSHDTGSHETGTHGDVDAPGDTDLPGDDVVPGNQPDGSWVGVEQGTRLTLDPHANAVADDLLHRAAQAEHGITPSIREITGGIDGARMQGYDFVLKGEGSLKRKLATDLLEDRRLTPEAAVAGIKDSVRYTVEIPSGNYVHGVERAVADLRARGFENVTFKPSWDNPDGYKGLNSTWRDPRSGQVFELQFHTPDSFAAKMETHELYEAQRLPGISDAEVVRLQEMQADTFRRVPVPHGAEQLTDLRHALEASRPGGHPVAATGDAHLHTGDAHGSGHDPGPGHSADTSTGGADAGSDLTPASPADLPGGAATPDPFDALEPTTRQGLVHELVTDSNPSFPLTPDNAEAALRGGPPGTHPVAAGPGTAGADVRFVDGEGNTVLQREIKSVGGGYNSFNVALRKAAVDQLGFRGEVWVQVAPGTDVDSWVRKWQGTRGDARLGEFADVTVVFRDSEGTSLGRYALGDRLPPR